MEGEREKKRERRCVFLGRKKEKGKKLLQLTLYILIWLSGIRPTTSTSPSALACLNALAWP